MPLETRDVDQFLKLEERLREAPPRTIDKNIHGMSPERLGHGEARSSDGR